MSESDIWGDMKTVITAGFREDGYQQVSAQELAESAIQSLFKEYAGERLGYLPKKRQEERRAMVKKFNGHNHDELANEFGVSRATVYREIRRRIVNIR